MKFSLINVTTVFVLVKFCDLLFSVFQAAVKAGTINIVMPAWVEAVLKRAAANPGEDLSFDKELVKLYGVPIFSGLRISLTGITSMEMRKGVI